MKSLTDLAGNLDISTEQVLTALRIVAVRAGVKDLAKWASKELEGYEEKDELPKHRSWGLTVVASFRNPMQGFFSDMHVGDFAIAKQHRDSVLTFHCREGIGPIESSISNNSGVGSLGVEHPNLAQLVNSGPMVLGEGWQCTHAKATFSSMHLRGVVNRARQTALKLCLECEENGMDLLFETDDSASAREQKEWRKVIKSETTKAIIRDAWAGVRDYFFT